MKTTQVIFVVAITFVFHACRDTERSTQESDLVDPVTGFITLDGSSHNATVDLTQFIYRDVDDSCNSDSIIGKYDLEIKTQLDNEWVILRVYLPYASENTLSEPFMPTEIPRCNQPMPDSHSYGNASIAFENRTLPFEDQIVDVGLLVPGDSAPMSLSLEREDHVLHAAGSIERFVFKSINSNKTWVVTSTFTEEGVVVEYP